MRLPILPQSTPSNLNETETGTTTMSPPMSVGKASLTRRQGRRREKKTEANHPEEIRIALTEMGKKQERKVKYLIFDIQ